MTSVVPLILVILVSVLWCALYYRPRRKLWAMAKRIPGPKPYPLFGNSMLLMGKLSDTFDNLLKLHEDFGSVIRLWLGDNLTVMLLDPDDIQQVLGNARIRNRDYRMTRALLPFFGDGLLSNRDDVWKTHRKIITPTFHFKILETFVEIFGQKSQILVERLSEVADGRTFDVYKYISLCTLDAICETAIGTTVDSQRDGFNDFQNVLDDATGLVHSRVLKPYLLLDWLYPLTSDGRKAKPLIKKIKNFSDGIITQKLSEYRSGVRRTGITTSTGKTITSFLDMLIEASETQGSLLSPQEIQDEVTTMAAAGLETTASSMSFFLLLVAIHPEIQQQIFEELEGIFYEDDRTATTDDLHRMFVMERVIKETLRHFPIVTLLPREISEEVQLPSGYTLPKGCSALVMSYAVHRNEKYFPDPHKFLPDRWLPDNSKTRHPYAYLPFSAGVRNCVGQKYAMLQMKTILSSLLRKYKVTTNYVMEDMTKLEISITITLGPGKYLIQLQKR